MQAHRVKQNLVYVGFYCYNKSSRIKERMVSMEQSKIDRINFLAKKSKGEGLSPQERAEQKTLREEYIAGFRRSLKAQLDNTLILNPDGTTCRPRQKK